jgi:hypothetical protein
LSTADPINLWKRWDVIQSYATTSNLQAQTGNRSAALEDYRETKTLLANTIDDPTNILLHSHRANAYSEFGESLKVLALDKRTAEGQKRELLLEARSLYQRSWDVLQDMQNKSSLSRSSSSKLDQVVREIAECNHALEK